MNSYKYLKIYTDSFDKALKPSTIIDKLKHVRLFLGYCESLNIESLKEINKMDVYSYVDNKKWASQTASSAQFTLRSFFNVMFRYGLSTFDGNSLYPIIFTNKREHLMSYYSPQEIKSLIDNINVKSPCGIRNKCMVTIAATTGLRASDVVFLKFSEINWDKKTFSLVQKKTGVPVTIPFSDEVKYLILDYWKNYRPNVSEEYLFINNVTNAPFKDAAILTQIVGEAFIHANIDIKNKKYGAHTLRHSLATNLLLSNTPLPIITGVLGHTTVTTTEKYISIDIEGLRSVSLEVPQYE